MEQKYWLGRKRNSVANARRATNAEARLDYLNQAREQFDRTLGLDSENVTAHYNLALIYGQLGVEARAEKHRKEHERYRPDDNARDRAIVIHRRQNPAADHAAQSIVIYSLQRQGAPGLKGSAAFTTAKADAN